MREEVWGIPRGAESRRDVVERVGGGRGCPCWLECLTGAPSAAELHVDVLPVALEHGTNKKRNEDARQDLGMQEKEAREARVARTHRIRGRTAAERRTPVSYRGSLAA